MSEREARDFMSVDSFSQLPFIRSAPKPSSATSGIRLFGIEVPRRPNTEEDNAAKDHTSTTTNGGGETARKFECHYCRRQFPTSQALGGHQNAHKRERQHAKRAHRQSAALAAARHHPAAVDGHHVYGLVNYHHHRLGPVLPAAAAGFTVVSSPAPHHPPWHNTGTADGSFGACFHGGLGSMAQPIVGSPLPGLWRVPGVVHGGASVEYLIHGDSDRMPLPVLRGGGGVSLGGNNLGTSSSSSSSAAPKSQCFYPLMPGVKENVNLDLHL